MLLLCVSGNSLTSNSKHSVKVVLHASISRELREMNDRNVIICTLMVALCAGCPVSQEIEDNVQVTASGDGLECGVENVKSMFEVQSVGQQGDLSINVVGTSECIYTFFLQLLC